MGCDRCRGTGYRGRIRIFEIFRLNDEMHELVLKRESTRTLADCARKHGMRTLGQSGWEKIKAGHTTFDEVLRVVTLTDSRTEKQFAPLLHLTNLSRMSDKQAVIEAISRLPNNVTLLEINEEIATLEAIRRGVLAAEEGRVKSHEEVKRLVVEWTTK